MTKPREKTREELQAEIEDGKKKIRQFENREKIHDTDKGNPHCHIMLTMRPLNERGAWAAKSKKEYDLDENGERIRLTAFAVDIIQYNAAVDYLNSLGIAVEDLMFCADCGAKMYNHRGKAGNARDWAGRPNGKKRPDRDEYNCSRYDLGTIFPTIS